MNSNRKQGRPFRTDPLPAAQWGAVFHPEVPGYFFCPCYAKWMSTAGRQQHEKRRVHLTFMRWARHGRLENVRVYDRPPLADVFDDSSEATPCKPILDLPPPKIETLEELINSGDSSDDDFVNASANELIKLAKAAVPLEKIPVEPIPLVEAVKTEQ